MKGSASWLMEAWLLESGYSVACNCVKLIRVSGKTVISAVALGFCKKRIINIAIDFCPGMSAVIASFGIRTNVNLLIADRLG